MSRVAASAARWLFACMVAGVLAACAQLPRDMAGAEGPVRSGRLAMTVADQPNQSFSAGFELRGQPQAGQLTLTNPLGGTLAQLQWQPGSARLLAPGQAPQDFPSLDAMVERATGAPVPVAALFDWLGGTATPVPGWDVDLSQLAEGRMRAQRRAPPPTADLRVVLDR